jgi:putative transcriptional regulator
MDKTLFDDLLQSLKEAKTLARGQKVRAVRQMALPATDVQAVRERTGLSQSEFARLMRVSTRTLQNWEQHRRQPTGPAAALLTMVATAPEVVLKTLHS